jgi:quinol monooxygenase YgiN
MYVVIARWVARDGEEADVERVLKTMAPLSREEPGCKEFTVLRSADEPRTYLLYEVYDGEASFLAHRETDHFKKHVVGDGVPRLEARTFAHYEIVA